VAPVALPPPPQVAAPQTPDAPDFTPELGTDGTLVITLEEYRAVFRYITGISATFGLIYETLKTGVGFTPESIQAEIDFNAAMLEAIERSFGGGVGLEGLRHGEFP
jgi:hypothetical protein